jgi:hypothetical protein
MGRRAVWLLFLALIFGPSSSFGAEPDHAEHDHQVARILETRVHPKRIEIHSTDAIGWLNYSSKRARISFDAEVVKGMTCRSVGSFHLDGTRLTSSDIQATQFASLCSLAPGEYEYRVELKSGIGGSGSPGKSFAGKIVVSK